jgi:hypothetical protein
VKLVRLNFRLRSVSVEGLTEGFSARMTISRANFPFAFGRRAEDCFKSRGYLRGNSALQRFCNRICVSFFFCQKLADPCPTIGHFFAFARRVGGSRYRLRADCLAPCLKCNRRVKLYSCPNKGSFGSKVPLADCGLGYSGVGI